MTARRDHVFTAHVRTKSMDTSVTVICSTGEKPVINVFLYFSLINLKSIIEFSFNLQPPTLVLLSFRHVVRNIIYRRRNFYIVFLIAPFLTVFLASKVTKSSSKKSGKRQIYRHYRYVRYHDHHLFCLILQSFVKILFA